MERQEYPPMDMSFERGHDKQKRPKQDIAICEALIEKEAKCKKLIPSLDTTTSTGDNDLFKFLCKYDKVHGVKNYNKPVPLDIIYNKVRGCSR